MFCAVKNLPMKPDPSTTGAQKMPKPTSILQTTGTHKDAERKQQETTWALQSSRSSVATLTRSSVVMHEEVEKVSEEKEEHTYSELQT